MNSLATKHINLTEQDIRAAPDAARTHRLGPYCNSTRTSRAPTISRVLWETLPLIQSLSARGRQDYIAEARRARQQSLQRPHEEKELSDDDLMRLEANTAPMSISDLIDVEKLVEDHVEKDNGVVLIQEYPNYQTHFISEEDPDDATDADRQGQSDREESSRQEGTAQANSINNDGRHDSPMQVKWPSYATYKTHR